MVLRDPDTGELTILEALGDRGVNKTKWASIKRLIKKGRYEKIAFRSIAYGESKVNLQDREGKFWNFVQFMQDLNYNMDSAKWLYQYTIDQREGNEHDEEKYKELNEPFQEMWR